MYGATSELSNTSSNFTSSGHEACIASLKTGAILVRFTQTFSGMTEEIIFLMALVLFPKPLVHSHLNFVYEHKYFPSHTILEFCSVFIHSTFVDRFFLKLTRVDDFSGHILEGSSNFEVIQYISEGRMSADTDALHRFLTAAKIWKTLKRNLSQKTHQSDTAYLIDLGS